MKFVVVNGRTPRQQTRCALCCQPAASDVCQRGVHHGSSYR
jgi:hypothetical protein